MKVRDRDLNKIKIDKYLNEELWFRGIRNPPARIKVKAVKEGEIVRAELAEMPENLKFKKAREEKRETKATEAAKPKAHEHKEGEKHEEEKTEEDKKPAEEKKSATVESMQKFEKEAATKMKHQVSGKPNKATESRKGTLKSR